MSGVQRRVAALGPSTGALGTRAPAIVAELQGADALVDGPGRVHAVPPAVDVALVRGGGMRVVEIEDAAGERL